MTGTVFDIKEFAVHDGAGIRTTVFFKGCPLRCVWCHNPEGLSPQKELYIKHARCTGCGLCKKGCSHPDCQPYGRCLHVCPQNLVSVAGQEWDSQALAQKLLKKADFYAQTGGGITLSGGEPLMQADFAVALLQELKGKAHCAIETSGYAKEEDFIRVISLCDFVYMDIKLMDAALHKQYTGVDNARILRNATLLMQSNTPHTFRTPLIPHITDTEQNLAQIENFIQGHAWEKLPYNTLAGAKYASVGKKFNLQI